MSDSEKVLTYEEAKELCKKAFDGGVTYGTNSMRYNVNAAAYDWDHWLKENEGLFRPKPTVEDVLKEFAFDVLPATCIADHEVTDAIERFAPMLRLAGDAE